MPMMSFPVEEIRQEFLALQKIENNHFVTFFDAASGTQVAKSVVEAMGTYMKSGVGSSEGVHVTARETAAIVVRARDHVAQMVGAKKENIFFNGNILTFLSMFSNHLGNLLDQKQGNIVITEVNQRENTLPWTYIAKQHQLALHTIPYDLERNNLQINDLHTIITNETKIVALDFTSSITGVVHDLEAIIERAKAVGAIVIVNASHLVPYFAIDFEQMEIDLLLFSAHHIFGPHLGVAVMTRELIDRIEESDSPVKELLELGMTNYESIVGVSEMVQYISTLGEGDTLEEQIAQAYNRLSMYEAYLMNMIKQGLAKIPFVDVIDGGEDVLHVPIISFIVKGLDAKMVSHYLAQDNAIHVDYGSFGLDSLVNELTSSETGIVRVSLAPYNTLEEVERFLVAIEGLEERLQS